MTSLLRWIPTGAVRGLLVPGLLIGALYRPATAQADGRQVARDILEMTGNRRTKVVWNQGEQVKLFDTQTGRIEDLPIPHGSAPKFSADGTKVFVSAGQAPDGRGVYMYDTETKRVTEFPQGPGNNLLTVWQDPANGRLWVYVNGTGDHGEAWNQARGGAIHRFPVDRPEARELVWDRTSTHLWIYLSADGTRACFQPSWGNIGQMQFAYTADGKVDQENSNYQQFGGGCFPGFAPDNSYRLYRLDGNHRAITMHDTDNADRWQVDVSSMVDGRNVWLTHWSTHPRYITLMGPDSNEAKIWLGRFSEDFRQVEQWVQVNWDGPKSMQSHAWIEQDDMPTPGRTTPARRERVVEPAPEWPAAEGAVFALRENRVGTPVTAFDDRGREQMAFSLGLRGRSLLGRSFELVCDGGSFHARDAGTWIGRQVSETGAFTIEATLQPAEAGEDTRGVVLAFANDEQTDIALLQYRNWLYLRVRNEQPIPLFEVEAGRPVHVAVTGEQGRAVVYRNGAPVRAGPLPADATDWGERELVMGAAWNETHPWRGRLQGVSVYPRALSEQEVARQALAMSAVIADREPVERIRFRGTLVRQAETSAQEAIRPYTRSLTAAEYRVHSVLEGEWDEPTIMVLHWMVMDDKRLPIADREPGERVELVVELLDDQPQLESERRDELPDADLDTILFYCESEEGL